MGDNSACPGYDVCWTPINPVVPMIISFVIIAFLMYFLVKYYSKRSNDEEEEL